MRDCVEGRGEHGHEWKLATVRRGQERSAESVRLCPYCGTVQTSPGGGYNWSDGAAGLFLGGESLELAFHDVSLELAHHEDGPDLELVDG